MVDRPAHLSTLGLGLIQHGVEGLGLDPERDVQIQRVLALEVERRTGHLEEGEAGAVVHLEEGMERPAFVYLERADHPQTEEILVKSPCLFGITAAISIVVQPLHGGGYVIGSLDSHRHLVAEVGRAAGCWALALDYRLAPEHPFPAAVEDAVAGYRYLLARGVKHGRIAVAGDSAGGGLVVAAMVAIREAGLPQPGCGWCISPWVDMEMTGETMTSKAAVDPIVQRDGVSEMARLYLNGADPRSPLAAPIYADLAGLAPLLIQVGAAETLLDDAIRLAKVAGAADIGIDLQIWPEMVHVWHLFHPELKAGLRAIEAGGAFVRAHTSG